MSSKKDENKKIAKELLKDEKEMQKALANEQRFLKVDYLEKMVKILDKNNLILRKEYDSIISLKNQINSTS